MYYTGVVLVMLACPSHLARWQQEIGGSLVTHQRTTLPESRGRTRAQEEQHRADWAAATGLPDSLALYPCSAYPEHDGTIAV